MCDACCSLKILITTNPIRSLSTGSGLVSETIRGVHVKDCNFFIEVFLSRLLDVSASDIMPITRTINDWIVQRGETNEEEFGGLARDI